MDDRHHIEHLIQGLRDPTAYSPPPTEVVVRQTHISAVFLAGDRAYKLKKPVNFGFVDYSTIQKRRANCDAEVELNRRLAPHVYLGVRPVVEDSGRLRIGNDDDARIVDWVVEMVRLDDGDNFLAHLHANTLEPAWLEQLGRKMAKFHTSAERHHEIPFGSFETVSQNALDNFEQSADQVGVTVSESVFRRLRERTEQALVDLGDVIRSRDAAHITCDTHGDLRLEHVYRHDAELLVVDCIEFNQAFRYADPVADIAFLSMDLRIRWERELAERFENAYFENFEFGGRGLLNFYIAYRSAVRAKVHGLTATKPEVDDVTRERARYKSRAHWLFALSTVAPPTVRPALILVAGLPGSGKSTLARAVAQTANFEVVDSDIVRKQLAGVDPHASMRGDIDRGIYTPEWTERTYAECLRRAVDRIADGERVLVDATFRDDRWRDEFLRAAHGLGVTGVMLECVLPRDVSLERLQRRTHDVSDANAKVYEAMAAQWAQPSEFVSRWRRVVNTLSAESALRDAEAALGEFGLV